jgi:hypothetical protein
MGRPISKTTKFILALSRTLPAKEVLAKAKASGLKTSESNVHRVRRLHGGSKRAASAPRKASTVARTTSGSHSRTEELLRAVAAELGLGRALEILQGERARVRGVLGG